jgi:hypothetical protein
LVDSVLPGRGGLAEHRRNCDRGNRRENRESARGTSGAPSASAASQWLDFNHYWVFLLTESVCDGSANAGTQVVLFQPLHLLYGRFALR